MWLLNNKAVEAKDESWPEKRNKCVQIFPPPGLRFVVLSVFTQKKCFRSICVYAKEALSFYLCLRKRNALVLSVFTQKKRFSLSVFMQKKHFSLSVFMQKRCFSSIRVCATEVL